MYFYCIINAKDTGHSRLSTDKHPGYIVLVLHYFFLNLPRYIGNSWLDIFNVYSIFQDDSKDKLIKLIFYSQIFQTQKPKRQL